jgi:hypothetical protein
MLDAEILHEDGARLSLGREGERLYGLDEISPSSTRCSRQRRR